MSAKNGWMRSFRLLGCLMAVAILASALFASAASAKKPEPTNPTAYINMGDSVSYGYTQEKFDLNAPAEPPSAFEGGYPNLLAAKLAKTEAKAPEGGNKLSLINLACPGETSKGLIGNGPIAEGLLAEAATTHFSGGEAPCGWHNLAGLPRHFEFGGASQLEAAVGIIVAGEKKEGPEVKDVTLQIGSNDELHKLGECASSEYQSKHGFTSSLECIVEEAKKVVFPTIIINIDNTIGVLRHAGYTGPIGVLGFYNPQALLLGGSDALQNGLNTALAENLSTQTGVGFGNPFKKTNPQGKKSQKTEEKNTIEKEAICKYTEECNMFDKIIELEKAVKHSVTAAEVEAIETSPSKMLVPGDIHPTTAGDELFAKDMKSALKKA
jgi:hypothetical protein